MKQSSTIHLKARKVEDLTPLEKLGLLPVSHSRLETYETGGFACKAKYYYRYIQKLPGSSGPAASLGTVVHTVLEHQVQPETKISRSVERSMLVEYNDLILDFNSTAAEREVEPIPADLIRVGSDILYEFIDRHEGESWPIFCNELEFEFALGQGLFRGFIDRVDIYDDYVDIIDWKTGKSEAPMSTIDKNQQLRIYALAGKVLWPDKDIRATLYYLRSGKQKGHRFTMEDLAEAEEDLIQLVRKLVDETNFTPTSNYFVCKYCEYAVREVCKMGASRVR